MVVAYKNVKIDNNSHYGYVPSNTVAGDLIVVFVGQNSGTFTAPTNYSTIVARSSSVSTYQDSIGVFYKIATSGDANAQIFAGGGTGSGYYENYIVATFTGHHPTVPIAGFSSVDGGNSVTTPTYTMTAGSKRLFLASEMNLSTPIPNFTMNTSGYTLASTVAASAYRRQSLYYGNAMESAGTAGTVNLTSDYMGSMNGVSLAIADANSAPNTPTGVSVTNTPVANGASPSLSWTFSDPDAGQTQVKYQIRLRKKD